jgi:hypothetical protein
VEPKALNPRQRVGLGKALFHSLPLALHVRLQRKNSILPKCAEPGLSVGGGA